MDIQELLNGTGVQGIRSARVHIVLTLEDGTETDLGTGFTYEHINLVQEQEIADDEQGLHPTGKRQMQIRLWSGTLAYDDLKLLAQTTSPEKDDATGFKVAPARYSTTGRETIDRIHDEVGYHLLSALTAGCNMFDAAFVAYCAGAAMKYLDRAGHKDPVEQEYLKAKWYTDMENHVMGKGEDPRVYRKDFAPYVRPQDPPMGGGWVPAEVPERECYCGNNYEVGTLCPVHKVRKV